MITELDWIAQIHDLDLAIPAGVILAAGLGAWFVRPKALNTLPAFAVEAWPVVRTDQLDTMSEAAVDGLIVCDRGLIVSANRNFAELAAACQDVLHRSPLARWIPDGGARELLTFRPDVPVETCLLTSAGTRIPVQLLPRSIDLRGKPHEAIAVGLDESSARQPTPGPATDCRLALAVA